MANEARVTSTFHLAKGSIDYDAKPTTFNVTVTGQKGPTVGAFTASYPAGTDVDLSQVVVPGLCRIQNQDAGNFVTVGIWDPEVFKFYPVDEIGPGESWCRKLSRYLSQELSMTGTGTSGPATNTLRIRPDEADCEVLVEIFEA